MALSEKLTFDTSAVGLAKIGVFFSSGSFLIGADFDSWFLRILWLLAYATLSRNGLITTSLDLEGSLKTLVSCGFRMSSCSSVYLIAEKKNIYEDIDDAIKKAPEEEK